MNRTTRTTCPLDCPDACGVLVESDDAGRFVRLRGDPEHPWSRGVLCGKTQLYGELIESPDRLRTPLVRRGGKKSAELVPATWDEALDLVAARLRHVPGRELLALWYGGSMGLVQRRFPLRMMHALGATLHDGGICDATGEAGYQAVFGAYAGPDIETVDGADLVLLWGCDMVRTHQHLQPRIQALCKRGVPVIAIDVWRTETIRALERWGGRGLVLRPGTDAALALSLARIAFELGEVDHAFLQGECTGAAEFETHVRARGDLERTARITGVPAGDIAAFASVLLRARDPFWKTGVGFARRRNGGMNMRAVCSLAAVLGHARRVHFESAAHFGLAEEVVQRPELRGSVPDERVVQVALGETLCAGRFSACVVWCHNPAVTLPDSARVRRGLARDDLFLVVHEQFLTETAELADVVLPATMFPEHADVYRSYGHRVMQYARAATRAPEGPRSNVETFAGLAQRLGLPRETWDVTAEGLCEEFLAASRARLGDAALAELRAGRGVKPAELAQRGWPTPSGKVELASATLEALGQPRLATYVPDDWCGETGEFVLLCTPSVNTHNSTFVHSARHVKKDGPPRVHAHPAELSRLGVAEGERVTLSNARGAVTLPIAACANTPPGAVRIDGLPRRRDVPEGVGINALVSGATSDLGNGNVLYSTRVDVRPAR